jgi:hypothetical protein
MKVVRYEVPGKRPRNDPSRRVRYDRDLGCARSRRCVDREDPSSRCNTSIDPGDGSFFFLRAQTLAETFKATFADG